jgi:hypothetical protein
MTTPSSEEQQQNAQKSSARESDSNFWGKNRYVPDSDSEITQTNFKVLILLEIVSIGNQ